jgi:probable rRNA maturation factor
MTPATTGPGTSDPPDWFSNRQRSVEFDARGLVRFASDLRRRLARDREFAVCVASEAAVRRANLQFRGQNHATDVLSFPDGDAGHLGDLLICARQAARQAERLGHSVDAELKILVLHGVLHLLGHDHERDQGAMQRLESRWRRKLGLPAALIERAGNGRRLR